MSVVILKQIRHIEDVARPPLELSLPGDPLVEAVEEEFVVRGVGPAFCERETRCVEAGFRAEAEDGEEGGVVGGGGSDVVGGEEVGGGLGVGVEGFADGGYELGGDVWGLGVEAGVVEDVCLEWLDI